MPFTLKIVDQEKSGLVLIAAAGEATALSFPSAQSVLFDDLLGPDWSSQRILLDMDQVQYIDSSAVGWLLNIRKLSREAGGRLVLHSLQPRVRQILEMLKIGRVVPLAADLKSAKSLLRTPPKAAAAAAR